MNYVYSFLITASIATFGVLAISYEKFAVIAGAVLFFGILWVIVHGLWSELK